MKFSHLKWLILYITLPEYAITTICYTSGRKHYKEGVQQNEYTPTAVNTPRLCALMLEYTYYNSRLDQFAGFSEYTMEFPVVLDTSVELCQFNSTVATCSCIGDLCNENLSGAIPGLINTFEQDGILQDYDIVSSPLNDTSLIAMFIRILQNQTQIDLQEIDLLGEGYPSGENLTSFRSLNTKTISNTLPWLLPLIWVPPLVACICLVMCCITQKCKYVASRRKWFALEVNMDDPEELEMFKALGMKSSQVRTKHSTSSKIVEFVTATVRKKQSNTETPHSTKESLFSLRSVRSNHSNIFGRSVGHQKPNDGLVINVHDFSHEQMSKGHTAKKTQSTSKKKKLGSGEGPGTASEATQRSHKDSPNN